MTEKLPKCINVMKVVTYDVQEMLQGISEGLEKPIEDISLSDVLMWVEDWAVDDFGCGWGHKADLGGLIFQDENGEEL